jgi:hypothetical protein
MLARVMKRISPTTPMVRECDQERRRVIEVDELA